MPTQPSVGPGPRRRFPGHRVDAFAAVWLLILNTVTAAAVAQVGIGDQPLHELHQQVWTTREGLPHSTINAIAQTPDGYLWLGTWEGAARFNGYEFRGFARDAVTGLPDAGVLSLDVGPEGSLLVAGARGGHSLRREHGWQPLSPGVSSGVSSETAMIFHAIIDRVGDIWLATAGDGIHHHRVDETGQLISETRYLPGETGYCILERRDGTILVGTSEGLLSIRDGAVMLAGEDSGLPDAPVLSLWQDDDDGTLLVGTENGLYVSRSKTGYKKLNPVFDGLSVNALLRDAGGALWIGTINRGLFRYRDGNLDSLSTSGGLPNNRVLSLLQDREGSLWVGTTSGLFRLRSAPFVTLTRQEGLSGNFVRAVMPHPDGSLWIGTSEGVSRKSGRTIEPVRVDGIPFTLSTLSLTTLENGDVLIGTHSDGVKHWSNGQIVATYNRDSGLPSNDIRILAQDSRGRIWIGTASGLARVDETGIRVFGPDDGLPAEFTISILEDQAGTIWIGTSFGLARVRDDRLDPISFEHLDGARYIYGILEQSDEPGTLWLASDRGLIRYRPESDDSAIVGRDAGLPIDKYFEIVDDNRGNFWLTSNRGVFRIQRSQAHAVADGERESVEFEHYAEGDGLLSAQANGASGPPATWHEGRVWVATAVGLASVDPDYLSRYEDAVLPVIIESFAVDGIDYPTASRPDLPAGTSRIAFQYAGLGFTMPDRIIYRTRLDGFDDEWVERGGQTKAEYTNLGPGDYTLRVSATYPYGEWSGSEATVAFSIQRHAWQRPGFWVLALSGIVLLILAAIRLRVRQLEKRAGELHRQVESKTRELKRQAEEFERQARIDQLTGLANRRAFDEWLAREFRQAKVDRRDLTLVIMDLDHFKDVNDRHSHVIGDDVLRVIADVLRQHTRRGDQAARWGGEEFTLTFHNGDSRQAAEVAERIRRTIENLDFNDIAPGLTMTASFGLSDTRSADSYEALLRQADQALYRAKTEGRNRIVIHE